MKMLKKGILMIVAWLMAIGIGHAHLYTKLGNNDAVDRRWDASWITVPETAGDEYGVYYFRKTLTLSNQPDTFPIRVSGDTRYKLYVNGELVSLGPARSDVAHWRYESVDLADKLAIGDNVVAAVVWHEGSYRPAANVSFRTAFILQGETDGTSVLNTDKSWKCMKAMAYQPLPVRMTNYYVSGPGEEVDMRKFVTDWNLIGCDETNWKDAVPVMAGLEYDLPERVGETGSMDGWQLQPSPLPPMELTYERLQSVRTVKGCSIPESFPKEKRSFTIPSHTYASIILDQGHLTNAYFTLAFSEGKDASITAGYLESYYTVYPKKGNRDEVEGKHAYVTGAEMLAAIQMPLQGKVYEQIKDKSFFMGRQDRIFSSGALGQSFTSLYWRTFRYVQLDIETKDEPLTIDDVYGTFTGFPFQLKASLQTDDEEMKNIFEIGWRTARLCAVDTYMDCPYYEQLQYLGDSRIQALLSLYNTGDDRLVKNFLTLSDISRNAEGITMSRYPQTSTQVIPPFSLWYISSLYDFLMYGNDQEFLRRKLPGMRQVLNYFSHYQTEDGSLRNLPGWNFTDWVEADGWHSGVADKGADGHSSLMDLQLLYGFQAAARLEQELGMPAFALLYEQEAERLKTAIQKRYWDDSRGLYANRSERDFFSQHTNALAILTGMVTGDKAKSIAQKLLTDASLAPASVYFKFYLHEALISAGMGDDYMDWLGIWRDNMTYGMTTWGETSNLDDTRSDCHAWGASPNIEFFRTILGIDSDAPCFQKVKIEPHLGKIQKIQGEMPHPNGMISVSYEVTKNGGLNANIRLPTGTSGRFVWKGVEHALGGGENRLAL